MSHNGSSHVEVYSPGGENDLYEGAPRYLLSGINFAPQTQLRLQLLKLNCL